MYRLPATDYVYVFTKENNFEEILKYIVIYQSDLILRFDYIKVLWIYY